MSPFDRKLLLFGWAMWLEPATGKQQKPLEPKKNR
jgi:hypothetical protein